MFTNVYVKMLLSPFLYWHWIKWLGLMWNGLLRGTNWICYLCQTHGCKGQGIPWKLQARPKHLENKLQFYLSNLFIFVSFIHALCVCFCLCLLFHTHKECVILGYLESWAIFPGNDREMAGWDWLFRLVSRSVMTGLLANHRAVNAAVGEGSPGLHSTDTDKGIWKSFHKIFRLLILFQRLIWLVFLSLAIV